MGGFDPVGVLVAALGRALTGGVQSLAGWSFSRMIDALLATTRVDLGDWFAGPWRAMLAVGAALALPMLLVGVAGEVLAGRPARALRRGVVLPILLGPVLLAARAALGLALAAVDGLCAAVVTVGIGGPDGYARALERMRGLLGVGQLDGLAGTGTQPTLLVVAVVGVLAFVVWVELAVRAALVYLLVAFVPVALAGLFWSATARWARRLAETLAAVVLAQLVITVVMVLAAAALGGSDGAAPNGVGAAGVGAAVDRLAVGLGLLLLGSLALPMTLRMLPPVLEAAAVAGTGAAVSRRLRSSGGELLAATLTGGPAGRRGADRPAAAGRVRAKWDGRIVGVRTRYWRRSHGLDLASAAWIGPVGGPHRAAAHSDRLTRVGSNAAGAWWALRSGSAPVNAEAGPAPTYRFGAGPAGLWLGLGPGRLGVLGGGLVATVLGLYLRVSPPVAVLPLLAAAGCVWVPVAGRPTVAWIAPVAGHAAAALGRGARWVPRCRSSGWPAGTRAAGCGCRPSTAGSGWGRSRCPTVRSWLCSPTRPRAPRRWCWPSPARTGFRCWPPSSRTG